MKILKNNKIRKILFQLNHPAHFHLFKNCIDVLMHNGQNVLISVKEKDILIDLLKEKNYKFVVISEAYRKNNLFSILISLIKRDFKLYKIAKKFKPDLLIGTSPEIGHISVFLSSNSIFLGEDDVNLSPMMFLGALSCYPFFNKIISPEVCDNSLWNSKTVNYKGFQKLAYLHPNRFTPDRNKVEIPEDARFFILRFANLKAYHDVNAEGISNEIARKLIEKLNVHGTVLISSERALPNEFEQYRFRGNINDIHHYMAFADMYIGDSQSMAVESAILGTPGIRFNKFVGKISVLAELEEKYQLSFGIHTDDVEKLFSKVDEILQYKNLKSEFKKRKDKMLSEKIDVTAFMVWFIENYPESARIMKENPEFQNRFK